MYVLAIISSAQQMAGMCQNPIDALPEYYDGEDQVLDRSCQKA
jgi:hypothetical protein